MHVAVLHAYETSSRFISSTHRMHLLSCTWHPAGWQLVCLASEQEPHPPCLQRPLLLRLMHLLYRSERRGRTRKTMAHWSAPASCRSSPRCDDFSLSLPVTCTMHLGTEQALRPGRNRSRPITVAWHYCCITGDSAVSLVLLRYHCVTARGRLPVLQLFRCYNVQFVRQSKHLKPSQNLQCAMQVLRAWHTQGHRALVFTQTQQMLDIVEKAVAADGAPACLPQRLPPSLDELSHGARRCRDLVRACDCGCCKCRLNVIKGPGRAGAMFPRLT